MRLATTITSGLLVSLLIAATVDALAESGNGASASSQSNLSSRIYRSPEERREAGLGHQVTPWLKVSGLLELEQELIDSSFTNNVELQQDEGAVYNVQLGFDLVLLDNVSADITLEAERDGQTQTKVDEAVLVMDFDSIELEFGRLSVPFGEYYSHFVTGPILEFGETVTDGAVIGYAISDRLELSGFVIDSDAGTLDNDSSPDWGANLEYVNQSESVKLGIGFLSDLAESDEQLLADFHNRYARRVSAWNAYALLGFDTMEITAEVVAVTRAFEEFEQTSDKPFAYNIELAYFLTDSAQLALRYEASKEIEEGADSRYGINLTWRPYKLVLLSVDYLRSSHEADFVFDDDDNSLLRSELIAAQLAIEF